jgi:hypothetical protein
VVADADVDEILLNELPDSGDVRVITLFVQHRAAVAREATCATCATCATGGRSEEQLGAAKLAGC